MAVFGAILAVVLLNAKINGEITPESIQQFNIGQLFAFYKANDLCLDGKWFAVAKKVISNNCQWQIGKDLQPATITSENLPVVDQNGDCYFSCYFVSNKPESHPEKIISRRLKKDSVSRKDFDLYAYSAPCLNCIEGTDTDPETAELDEFNAVYYTRGSFGTQVKNDALLKKDILDTNGEVIEVKTGLDAIKETTKVVLSDVQGVIEKGLETRMNSIDLVAKIDDPYEKKAVKSYFDQHPQSF